ncbi:N-6 DNA methylase [Geodermatophilus siccatus]|nr:N-6 DNA methylase [Geodermatophilus siccatus]
MLEQLRHRARMDAGSVPALAVDAARSWSLRSAAPLPDLLQRDEENPQLRPALDIQRRWLEEADESAVADYLPALVYRLGGQEAGEHLSSPSIVRVALISALARVRPGTGALNLLDLTVGSGAMLGGLASAVAGLGYTSRVLGQELNSELATVAAATLYLQGHRAEVRVADSLAEDSFADESIDLAVSQPPFNLSWERQEQRVRQRQSAEGWYRFGLPRKSDATWLFASRMLEKLRVPEAGGGRAIVFTALGALTADSSDSVRKAILAEDLLEAVVALPAGLSPSTNIQLYALIFANCKAASRRGKVQVINLRPYFETSRNRHTTQRELQGDAFDVLRNSLASVRDGMASRTLPTEYFLRRRVTVMLGGRRNDAALDNTRMTWDVEIPESQDSDEFLRERYGVPVGLTWELTEHVRARLETDSVFDPSRHRLKRWLREQAWDSTRLSALLARRPHVVEPGDPRSAEPLLMLPTNPDAASLGTDRGDGRGRVLALELAPGPVSPDFLVSWLNTGLGRESRRRAHVFASSGTVIAAVRTDNRSLLKLTDELIVPIPPPAVQQELAAAEARLTAVAGLADRARQELWEAPSRGKQVVSRFDALFDETLGTWASDLPYPVASAVWTLETRNTIDARHKQMFLVWEAYAAFTGTVVLSALAQDPVLREVEVPQLRDALANAAVSMERATLGTWNVITQRLTARFRDMLSSDDLDERARLLQIFGGPSHDSLARLLSPTVVRLLNDANAKRNEWAGHTGAAPERELRGHLDYLTARLEELRDEVGPAWRELLCVRAGDGRRRQGQIHQKVELAMGPSTPFRQSEIRVGELMDWGDLYLATDGCAQPLRLQHLLVMRESPDNARYACYFYNRMQGEMVRIVSYHLTDRSDVTEELEDVAAAVHDLLDTLPAE